MRPAPTAGIDLVVTDLDGTLWDGEQRIHERTLRALHALAERDVPLLVATGRRRRGAEAALAQTDLAPPMVVLDGALGYVPATGRVFHRARFEAPVAGRVLDAFARRGVEPCVYVESAEVEVYVGDAPSTSPSHLASIGRWLGRDDLVQVCDRESVYAFGVAAGDPAALGAVLSDIGQDASGTVTRDLVHGGATLMVRPPGVSKWVGVLAWCADQGLDPGRVLAVGDGENDVELLTEAAVSCVLGDGCDAALALADHVLEPVGEGGWSGILDLC